MNQPKKKKKTAPAYLFMNNKNENSKRLHLLREEAGMKRSPLPAARNSLFVCV
jgi:hypothetical protein